MDRCGGADVGCEVGIHHEVEGFGDCVEGGEGGGFHEGGEAEDDFWVPDYVIKEAERWFHGLNRQLISLLSSRWCQA